MVPQPTLPPPNHTLAPPVNVAKAHPWPAGKAPVPAPGFAVTAFASELDHPRRLYVLPNGDVLVAETNAPPKPEDGKGIKAWFVAFFQKRAGARVQSANRITLLLVTDGDGVADLRAVFLIELNSSFCKTQNKNKQKNTKTETNKRFPYN